MNNSGEPFELTVYTDFICPWCYIGAAYLNKAQEIAGFQVRYVMYPLHPDTPSDGIPLEQLFSGRDVDIARKQAEIRERALKIGLDYKLRTHSYNSRRAQVIAKGLAEDGVLEPFQDAVFRAYFGKGENINRIDVLQGLLNSISPKQWSAERMVHDSKLEAAVHQDWQVAQTRVIRSVPTYQFKNRYCVGAQTSDSLLRLVDDSYSKNL